MRRLIPFYLLTLLGCVDLGRVVNDPSRLCPSGHRLVLDDQGRPSCVPREEPTPTPSPLPAGTPTPTPNAGTPTPTPTAVSTAQPATPSPTPSPVPPTPTPRTCVPSSVLTDAMVPVAYNEKPPSWTEPIRDQPDWETKKLPNYRHYNVVKAGTMDGEVPTRLSWRFWYGLTRQDLVIEVIRGVPVIRDNDPQHPGCFDGLGRWFPGDCSRPYANEQDGDRSPWTSHRHPVPEFCPDEPTPGPTPSGPTPTPIAGQIQDRAMDFINGCDKLRYPKRLDNGQVRGQCDNTERIGGRLPDGEYYRNACDPLHWTGDSEGARKTRVLCDHNGEPMHWDAQDGVRLEVKGTVDAERDEANPFQWWLTGMGGSTAEVRACPQSVPIRTEDGRTLPVRGDGCGPWKTVKFEVSQ